MFCWKALLPAFFSGGSAVEFSSALEKSNPAFDIGMIVGLAASNEKKLTASAVRNYEAGIAVKFFETENALDLLNSIVSEK